MIKIRPFRGYRPAKGLEDKIASKPYDVIDYKEAMDLGKDNPFSFVHIIRAELDMPDDTNPYSQEVYRKAKDNLEDFIQKGYLAQEDREVFYIYRQIRDGRVQNGIVGCNSIDDYANGKIKRHEFTRPDKEEDRINHFYEAKAHTEPVFLFYERNKALKEFIEDWTCNNKPIYDFTCQDDVKQILWIVDKKEAIEEIVQLFSSLDRLYIADGHHRTASSYKVGMKMREENPDYRGDEGFNYILSVIFPEDELYIMAYNRMVRDLNDYSIEGFMERIGENFHISELDAVEEPRLKGEFTMVLRGQAYKLCPRENIKEGNIESLDVSLLQNKILSPILGIDDPRTDERIEFVGGKDMMATIKARINRDMEVAFLLYPTQIEEIISVSNDNKVMPPKSTWFEPKLMSGLFLHKF